MSESEYTHDWRGMGEKKSSFKRKLEIAYFDHWVVWMNWAAWGKAVFNRPLLLLFEFGVVKIAFLDPYGIKLSLIMSGIIYIIMLIAVIFFGGWYAKMGVQKIENTVGNKQNKEFMTMVKDLELIKKKLDI